MGFDYNLRGCKMSNSNLIAEVGELDVITRKKDDGSETTKASVLVKLNPRPVIYSKLNVPKDTSTLTTDSKYVVIEAISEADKEELLDALAPLGDEIAKLMGYKLPKPARTILDQKLKAATDEEGLEVPGEYTLGANSRMAFFNKHEDGTEEVAVQKMSILGEDGKPLQKLFLTDGTQAAINVVLTAAMNPSNKKPTLLLRLEAVLVTKAVYFESNGSAAKHDDFSHIKSDY
jgi:hypothetical protein